MQALAEAISFSFAALFPVVNPIGSSVIFLAIAKGSSRKELNKAAAKISIYASIMLIVSLYVGSWILKIFGITIPIVLIGGGLVLAYIGWQLLNEPEAEPVREVPSINMDTLLDQKIFYPLTMPVTSGPSCIAVAIAIGAHSLSSSWEMTFQSQLGNTIGILLLGVSVFVFYRYADAITGKLGVSGTRVIMRLAAFINLCIGLEIIWHGIQLLKF